MRTWTLLTSLLVAASLACPSIAPAQSRKEGPAPKRTNGAGSEPGSKSTVGPLTGTVLESLEAGPYMYLRLKTPKGETWAAVNKTNLKKGSEVTIVNPIPMDGFESKTLNRKFDHIVFGSLAGTGATDVSNFASGHSPSAKPPQNISEVHANVEKAPEDTAKIKIKKAEGKNGKMIAEIFAAKSSLKDASIEVRGKVVKYNPGIMGKNWIHIRDGSGSPEKKNDDIAVTTLDSAAVGDTVLVKGTVRVDRDFGAGYRYPVIIEDAKVSK
jgi:hypothetical protein